jgi:hypothetical protein
MGRLDGCLADDVVVRRVRANLYVLGPSDLTVPTNVNRAEESLIRQRSKYSPPNICREVNHARYPISIGHL